MRHLRKLHTPKGNVMVLINPQSITHLNALLARGVPVTMTSHPGNASLYKLVLWSCGMKEHLWDVTCAKADANNWPMYRLVDGAAELLVSDELHERIVTTTTPEHRFVTAYQHTKNGERLGRVHVRAMQELFHSTISTCSRLLLAHQQKVGEMFSYLAETRDDVFTRYIQPDGVMMPVHQSTLCRYDYTSSFMGVLKELTHLLLSDTPLETKGGACYEGVMVPLATMLAQYWETGEVIRCDISGPDMIHYATRPGHQDQMGAMLAHLRKWDTRYVPKHFVTHMFPGTGARVGYIPGHVSETIMGRKIEVLTNGHLHSKDARRALWEMAKQDEELWPIAINQRERPYFSQHDLVRHGGQIVTHDFWKGVPLSEMKARLTEANALLHIR
jgi:hypothetical protein